MYKFILTTCLLATMSASAQNLTKPEETEDWSNEPRIVTPAAKMGEAPSDAVVLFDGKNFDEWHDGTGKPAQWFLAKDGTMTVIKGAGDIHTRKEFGDCQLHIEWRSPIETEELKGQQKGNSGVFFQERYEIQILNSYKNRTYSNGQATAVYKQHIPLANATAVMGEWNTYDIIYTAPRFRKNGSVETPAYFTVIHNGVLTQNHVEVQGTTEYIGAPKYITHGNGSFKLQDHGNAVSYRNIWVRSL